MGSNGSETGLSPWAALALVFALPLGVNLWKALGRGYLLTELWRHVLLDVSVVGLLLFVLAVDPLEKPMFYGGLYLYFCASFLLTHPPAGPFEWFGSLVALGLVGFFFPHLYHLTGLVAVGLLLAYVFVVRLMLPELSRGEALEALEGKRPAQIAAECLDTALGYERFFIGIEKLRYFLLQDEDYRKRLAAMEALHGQATADMTEKGISFVDFSPWGGAEVRPEEGADPTIVKVRFRGNVLKGRLIERGEDGVQLKCRVRVPQIEATLKRLPDGGLRVVALPDSLTVELVED
jgi:hypothetical protein